MRTQVGDRYVVEEMRRGAYNFGGEQSGLLIFMDHATTGDGVVAALSLLSVMLHEQKPLSELARCISRYPQVLVNVGVGQKRPLDELPRVSALISDIENKLGPDGRIFVRYSGTESTVRVMVEGPDARLIRAFADEVASALASACA